MRILLCLIAGALCAAGASCARQPDPPPYKPVATVLQLMEGPIGHAAEVYWDSVSTIVDKDGIHENFPQNDTEWTAVWNASSVSASTSSVWQVPTSARPPLKSTPLRMKA